MGSKVVPEQLKNKQTNKQTKRRLFWEDVFKEWTPEADPASSCKQARLPAEGLGHQPRHRTFVLQFALPYVLCWDKGDTEIMEVAANDWSSLKPVLRGSPALTLPGAPGPRYWTAQSPRTEPTRLAKKKERKEIIPHDILLSS